MTAIISNPGAEWHPERHSHEAAARNLEVFADELREHFTTVTVEPLIDPEGIEAALLMGGTRYQADHDGRYPFRLTLDGVKHVIEVPGLALGGSALRRRRGSERVITPACSSTGRVGSGCSPCGCSSANRATSGRTTE